MYLDLYHKVRTDGEFKFKVEEYGTKLSALQIKSKYNAKAIREFNDTLLEFFKFCNFNMVFLTGFYFPRYPKDKPLLFSEYGFSFQLFNIHFGGFTVIRGSRQISKCRSVNAKEPIYAENGDLLYPSDIQIGQRILCVDDNCKRSVATIIDKHQTGKQQTYKVSLRSGRSLLLSAGHQLRTFNGWTEVQNLKPGDKVAEMRIGGFFQDKSMRQDRIVLTAYMLGDGCAGVSGNFNFTSACDESLKEFRRLAEPIQKLPVRQYTKPNNKASSVCLSRLSSLRTWLDDDGLYGKPSWKKFIPKWVFQLSEADTRLFISRLWSTDGSVTQTQSAVPQITYTSVSSELSDGVRSLLLKFGIESTITSGIGACNGKLGRKYYRVRVKGRRSWQRFVDVFTDIPGKPVSVIDIKASVSNNNDDVLPVEIFDTLDQIRKACQHVPAAAFKPNGLSIQRAYNPGREKLERYLAHGRKYVPNCPALDKLDYWLNQSDVTWSNVRAIDTSEENDTWDIETDVHHNYILDGIVSHNSTSFAVRQLLLARLFPGFSSLYISPRSQQLETYANRLQELVRAQMDYKPDYKLRQNLHLKEFSNGSKIELAYVLTSAANVRSKSCDEMLIDESQDFDPDLEIEVEQVQQASEYPVTFFAGTSLTTDTFLEKKYGESSAAVWAMPCTCGHTNIPLPDQGVMDMIQPIGPCCAKCGKLLNIRAGRFLHANMQAFEAKKYGFHIPQLVVPAVVNNPIRWAKIYERKNKGDYRKFLQEILGIPTEEGEREITRKQLQDICTLGKDLGLLQRNAMARKYQYIVSGCDWGGSDYQPMTHTKISTTVHVIMGVTATGMFDILQIKRFTGMNYDDIIGTIVRDWKQHNGFALASDFGVGAVYNSKLREFIPPEKHLIFNYVGPATALISEPKEHHLYNQWSINKTESLSFTFDAIRQKRIKCFAWDYAEEYLTDCLNMYRAPGEKAGNSGTNTFIYRSSASRPNDTLQAINYAYMLGKILIGEPMFADMSVKLRLESHLRGQFNYGNLPGAYSG